MSAASSTAPFVLAFGDSLTAGHALPRADGFAPQLERLLRATRPAATVHNAGVSGDTTASGLARLPRLLSGLARRPDLAIVELGANDMMRLIDPAITRRNLDAILAELGRCGIPVLLAGMMAPSFLGQVAARFNALYADLAAQHGAGLYPFFLQGAVGRGMTLTDGVHPNARAVGIIARGILPSVNALLDRADAMRAA